jgi:hypothetical protein
VAWSKIVALALAAGVGGDCSASKESGSEPTKGISRTASADGVEITATVSPAELPFDQRARLVVEVTADPTMTVEIHSHGDLVREAGHQYEFRALPRQRAGASPAPGKKLVWKREYDLEFFLPGDYEVPGAVVTYFRSPFQAGEVAGDESPPADEKTPAKAPATADQPGKLETEPLPVKAAATAQVSAEDLKEIKTLPPVELPEPWRIWWALGPALAVIGLVALLLWRSRRGPQVPAELLISADEWARRELAALVTADLIARNRVQEFHYRISDILRGYIERRYGVPAAEMTTEEFLTAAARDSRFGPSATAELNRFLTACDMVKYARFEPDTAEAESLLRIVGEFVERTRERPREIGQAGEVARRERAA